MAKLAVLALCTLQVAADIAAAEQQPQDQSAARHATTQQRPTYYPTYYPTHWPTSWPTSWPTEWPTYYPTKWPTRWPTAWPTYWPVYPVPGRKAGALTNQQETIIAGDAEHAAAAQKSDAQQSAHTVWLPIVAAVGSIAVMVGAMWAVLPRLRGSDTSVADTETGVGAQSAAVQV